MRRKLGRMGSSTLSTNDEEFVDSEWPDNWPGIEGRSSLTGKALICNEDVPGSSPGGGSIEENNKKNMQTKGYVSYVGSKPWKDKVFWSFRLKNEDKWFGTGTANPSLAINDQVEFDYVEKEGRFNVSPGTIKKLTSDTTIHQGTGSETLTKSASPKSDYALKEQYWSDKAKGDVEKDLRIQWQSARNAAIEAASLLVAAGVLTLPAKNGSDAVLGKVADLTERFYRESANPPSVDDGDGNVDVAATAAA